MANSISIHPNPTKDIIHIKTDNETIPEVKLFSIDGRMLLQVRSAEIDMAKYPAGIYFVQVEDRTVKVVKE